MASPHDLEKLVSALRRIDANTPETQTPVVSLRDAPAPSLERWAHLAVVSTIAAGPPGTVYRAHDPRLGVDVALTLLPPTTDRERTSRFLQEGRLLARVHHPNVVRRYGSDETDGYAGMWTELVRGRTLEECVDTDAPFSEADAAAIGRDLCHAAAAVHQAGLPHRDITAGDVIRDAAGRTILMAPGTGAPTDEAGVVNALGALMRRLLASADVNQHEPHLPDRLASVLARATSSQAGRLATLDALDAALARTISPNSTPAPRRWNPFGRWPGLLRLLRRNRT